MNLRPIIIMRATQKKMMSKPVTRTDVGYHVSRSRVFSGQPSVENGQRPEENQVSSTSGSWRRFSSSHCGHVFGSSRRTIVWPFFAQYHAGMRCPHHSCREMHQSWMFSIQEKYVFSQCAGPKRERVRLAADEDAVALEIGDEALARGVAVEPGVRAGFGGHHRALVHHRHHRQLVTQPDLE